MEASTAITENNKAEMEKMKRLIKKLQASNDNGSLKITYALTPSDTIEDAQAFLSIEFSQAANIKTQATKDSVQSAITSAKEKLKAYQSMPKNGLIIFCGNEISTDLEPLKPVQSKLYKCDTKFHTECLDYLLEDDKKFGFVIVDATGALFASV